MNSIFEIFKIGIGPSSSHTVAPMKAGKSFRDELLTHKEINNLTKIEIILQGSLAFTGKGHGTDLGVVLGLNGQTPHQIDNKIKKKILNYTVKKKIIKLDTKKTVSFSIDKNIIFDYKTKTKTFSNVMIFTAFNENKKILSKTYYSIGGGFIKEKNKKIEGNLYNFPYSCCVCSCFLGCVPARFRYCGVDYDGRACCNLVNRI